jgi:hypothetical protein
MLYFKDRRAYNHYQGWFWQHVTMREAKGKKMRANTMNARPPHNMLIRHLHQGGK